MASLPNYVAAAKPVPKDARSAWYKNTAQTYAGIMLWFVFWQDIVSGSPVPGGSLAAGLGVALGGLVVAALFCHFLTYLVPGLFGMKTGLPLYVIGTSTYGVLGGFIVPGFLMGLLQFGWLAVNGFFSCLLICKCFGIGLAENGDVLIPGPVHGTMTVGFIILAVFIGLKGIQYVARVATFVPLIPLGVLIVLLVKTAGGLGNFDPAKLVAANEAAAAAAAEAAPAAEEEPAQPAAKEEGAAAEPGEAGEAGEAAAEEAKPAADPGTKSYFRGAFSLPTCGALFILFFLSKYVVGFFATAGAAGVDFGMNNRSASDVQLGGLVGIVGATVFAGAVSMLVVAGAYGSEGMIPAASQAELNPVNLMPHIVGETGANVMLFLLALSSFAPACFPAFIAANSFKTTMPNVSPWISVGLGTLAAIGLAVSGWAGQAVSVFLVVGASFGPICGAMMADYLLAGCKWAGPRAGFNLAGWISWAVGFAVGGVDLVAEKVPALAHLAIGIPCPPMAALIVGFVLYILLAMIGLQGKTLDKPQTAE